MEIIELNETKYKLENMQTRQISIQVTMYKKFTIIQPSTQILVYTEQKAIMGPNMTCVKEFTQKNKWSNLYNKPEM